MSGSGSTALLCLMVFASTASVGAFGPLLPEIARAQALPDWQIGVLAGSFGLSRMIADLPAGALAGRRLGITLALAPALLVAGTLLLWSAGPFAVLVLGRMLVGFGHTLTMVGGLTAILFDQRAGGGSLRLNAFEFAGMLGILGGLGAVGLAPAAWGWPTSLLVACSPALISVALVPRLLRRFPGRAEAPARPEPAPAVARGPAGRLPAIVPLMAAVGVVMAVIWSAAGQFLIPLRGAREFGLDRAGVSRLLALAQVVDLCVLFPAGWLADRAGRLLVVSIAAGCLGLGIWAVGLGSLPIVVAGCVLLGLGMAGWMLPLGVIREYTDPARLAWRTGLYRVGVDAAAFLGPVVCGLIGEAHAGVFVGVLGCAALAVAGRLAWPPAR